MNEGKIVITFEAFGGSYSASISDESTLDEVLKAVSNLIKMVGYFPEGELSFVKEDMD